MKLMTQEIRNKMPAIRGTDGKDDADIPIIVKYFYPVGSATWFITEADFENDLLFGLCDLGMGTPELGYVRLSELEGVEGPSGLGIERDLYLRDGFNMEDAKKAVNY